MTSSASSPLRGLAVVTGASSGIGAATARRLAAEGFTVWAAARRIDRLRSLAAESAGSITAVELDVTSPESVARLSEAVSAATSGGEHGLELTLLVNNAGGAVGLDPVADADPADWLTMYQTNVLGAMRVTQALLPALAAGSGGHIVLTGSIAGHGVYPGGGGYSAAKYGARAMMETLRLELNGRRIRVSEIDPGMVATEEFSLVRFGGDAERAAAVYDGVDNPLTAEDVADVIAFVATRPAHVNIDAVTVKPVAQAASYKLARGPLT
ncbi:SDR family NAD(P)-dependent oxidoreductase [Jatrophihabitans telluris]|uniref:SDR family NAD(P)-dependent oxidoreductase n=1 Tax=Jatrophihabitans telluris TaxID=2038343 RepID=A0ABY4QZB5_9ACTN|nr:SDR family NAD(P)-dependent oxidoreductase [Jatrophihabitans telluris]UQX88853.1 SDR family NAD(P)-dependent oxidoreductase [Jatrophihabitans telluris]